MIDRQDDVACRAIAIGALLPDAAGRMHFKFFDRLRDRLLVRCNQPFVAGQNRHDRYRLWRRDREIVKVAGMGESRPVRYPVRAVPLA